MNIFTKNLRVSLLLLAIAGTALPLLAQPEMPGMGRFLQEKMKYFNEQLELSEKESETFWPIYQDFQNRMMKLNEDESTLLNYYNKNSDALSDAEVQETIDKFQTIQDSRIKLSRKYHDKFEKAIGKKKTMKMYAIEREFRKHVLRRYRSAGEGSQDGRGRGRFGPR